MDSIYDEQWKKCGAAEMRGEKMDGIIYLGTLFEKKARSGKTKIDSAKFKFFVLRIS
jgi:hypothetical protein